MNKPEEYCIMYYYLIKDQIKSNVTKIEAIGNNECKVYYGSSTGYSYSKYSIKKVELNIEYNPSHVSVYLYGKLIDNLKEVKIYKDKNNKNYCYIKYKYNKEETYSIGITITTCAENIHLDYLKYLASKIKIENNNFFEIYYSNITKDSSSLLSYYLNPNNKGLLTYDKGLQIYPFGINTSQRKAITNALTKQISVIQGPPGTGKTQTILNIVANLLIRNKSICIVSNNNEATRNVYEKLDRYGLGFLVADVGSKNNKETFINEKQKDITVLDEWNDDLKDFDKDLSKKMDDIDYKLQLEEDVALCRQELIVLENEQRHFINFFKTLTNDLKIIFIGKTTSEKILKSSIIAEKYLNNKKKFSFISKFKLKYIHGVYCEEDINKDIPNFFRQFQLEYFEVKMKELNDEIVFKENELKHFSNMDIKEISMKYLKSYLYNRRDNYCKKLTSEDLKGDITDFQKRYPVCLSTTHSVYNSIKMNTSYDYIIMDEASQVGILQGALSLACASNIVVVGDEMQLPNIVSNYESEICKKANYPIKDYINHSSHSFLSSLNQLLDDDNKTLLKEHYRCHPKIINFCNQKFYNNKLIAMTIDNGETDVINIYKTKEGTHKRNNTGGKAINNREVEVIANEIIPNIKYDDIGITSPYNGQVDNIKSQINGDFDIMTIHKFQGREKDAMIISLVDDEFNDFTNNPNLINVAVSRAKKSLSLVTTSNKQSKMTHIDDLVKYVEYYNLNIINSNIVSCFDNLFSKTNQVKEKYLRNIKEISRYDTENVMFRLIEEILVKEKYSSLAVTTQVKLWNLIDDMNRLTDKEIKFASNYNTSIDFLIYNKFDNSYVLAIEVDGYKFHNLNERQIERDKMKDNCLRLNNIELLRCNTTGSGEEEKIMNKLDGVIL